MHDSPSYFMIGFAGGVLGFAHCLSMCGAFVLQLSQGQNGPRSLLPPLCWHAGRISSYLLLGVLAGCTGGAVAGSLGRYQGLQNLLSVLAGVSIVLAGLSLLGLRPVAKGGGRAARPGLVASLAGKFLVSPNPGSALVLGLGSGLLPCPIVLGFLALALQSGSAVAGLALMAGVGLGTLLPLMVLSCFSLLAMRRVRLWGSKLGAVLLVLLGLVTVLRATPFPHHLLGCPAPQSAVSSAPPASQPCCLKPDAAIK